MVSMSLGKKEKVDGGREGDGKGRGSTGPGEGEGEGDGGRGWGALILCVIGEYDCRKFLTKNLRRLLEGHFVCSYLRY